MVMENEKESIIWNTLYLSVYTFFNKEPCEEECWAEHKHVQNEECTFQAILWPGVIKDMRNIFGSNISDIILHKKLI